MLYLILYSYFLLSTFRTKYLLAKLFGIKTFQPGTINQDFIHSRAKMVTALKGVAKHYAIFYKSWLERHTYILDDENACPTWYRISSTPKSRLQGCHRLMSKSQCNLLS